MITFRCPNAQCPKTFSVKDEFGGKKTKCPMCGALIVVPIPQEFHPEPSPSSQVVPVVFAPPPLNRTPAVSVPAVDVAAARSQRKAGRRMHGTARALWDRANVATKIGVICGGVVLLLGFAGVALMIVTRDRSSPQKQTATGSRSKETGSPSSTPEDAFRLFVQAVQSRDVEKAFALDASQSSRLAGKFKEEIAGMKEKYSRHFEGSPSRYAGALASRVTGTWPLESFGDSNLVSDIRLLIPPACRYEISDVAYAGVPAGPAPTGSLRDLAGQVGDDLARQVGDDLARQVGDDLRGNVGDTDLGPTRARLLVEARYSDDNNLVYVGKVMGVPIDTGRGLAPIPAVFSGGLILTTDHPFFSVREYSRPGYPHKSRLEYERKDIKRAVLEITAVKINGSWLIGDHSIFLVDDSGRRSLPGGVFVEK